MNGECRGIQEGKIQGGNDYTMQAQQGAFLDQPRFIFNNNTPPGNLKTRDGTYTNEIFGLFDFNLSVFFYSE